MVMESYQVPKIAKKYTQYDMIQTHTDLPEFPQHRTSLLYVFLKNGAIDTNSNDVHQLYSLVTSLVQMGLDTHDMVEVEYDPSNLKQSRSNQLKVLAGDYFSSRFYQLLAEQGQISMIQCLSAAICEVNRLKMDFYLEIKQMQISAEEFMRQLVLIKMQLFVPFSDYLKDDFAKKWLDILYGFTRCEVIVEQWKRSHDEASFSGSWAFWYVFNNGSPSDKELLRNNGLERSKIKSLLLEYNVNSLLQSC